jgi:NAD(P)H-dependent FMN reductase
MALNVVVLFGSYRSDRLGIRVARFVEWRLAERGHTVRLVDARATGLPILDRMYKDYPKGTAPPEMERLASLYRVADAFVIVGGEYNHGIQPGLKNLLDHFLEEYFWRPSGIVTYSAGMYGGARAGVQLRDVVGELGMPSIPTMLHVPKARDVFDEQGQPKDPAWDRRFARFASELQWYAEALKAARETGTPY